MPLRYWVSDETTQSCILSYLPPMMCIAIILFGLAAHHRAAQLVIHYFTFMAQRVCKSVSTLFYPRAQRHRHCRFNRRTARRPNVCSMSLIISYNCAPFRRLIINLSIALMMPASPYWSRLQFRWCLQSLYACSSNLFGVHQVGEQCVTRLLLV